jgi:hypothetical protein
VTAVASEPVWEYSASEEEIKVPLQPYPVPQAAVPKLVAELKPGTEAFDLKNTRRFELIEKRVDSVLSPEEEAEFQSLQAEILAVTKKHFPRPRVNRELWLSKLKEGADGKSDSPN